MNIRTQLTLRFTAIVATILLGFSLAVYLLSEDYRKEEFFNRLESRAVTTARLFVSVQEVDVKLLRIIDRNSIHALFEEKVLIFDPKDRLVYSSSENLDDTYPAEMLSQIRKRRILEFEEDDMECVGIVYEDAQGEFVVVASAYDRYGRSKLNNLRNVLLAGLVIGILIILATGIMFAGQVLQPLARINAEVQSISAGSLGRRVDEGNQRDEIAQLAMNFNDMLQRLESAFEIQQQFVSNASHELRNPLAAITSQLQLMLDKERSPEEYRQALQSLLDDTRTLVELTNGLLSLAQSGVEKQRFTFTQVRVDETLFAAQNELVKAHPNYRFLIEYDTFPEDEAQLTIAGNEHLLKTAFLNLMDNACKFSNDRTVRIGFWAKESNINISFSDNGAGITPEEQEMIFTPFYRGSNTQSSVKGYGIGLSLCHRIVQLHQGSIKVQSAPGKGSRFELIFPLFPAQKSF
ncbi:MAG: HAMP domain-containing protein [Saprospiraceae bacterium]|nr:HAMP domain-containing protein [Saprospiraceae bacterium]